MGGNCWSVSSPIPLDPPILGLPMSTRALSCFLLFQISFPAPGHRFHGCAQFLPRHREDMANQSRFFYWIWPFVCPKVRNGKAELGWSWFKALNKKNRPAWQKFNRNSNAFTLSHCLCLCGALWVLTVSPTWHGGPWLSEGVVVQNRFSRHACFFFTLSRSKRSTQQPVLFLKRWRMVFECVLWRPSKRSWKGYGFVMHRVYVGKVRTSPNGFEEFLEK